MSGPGYCRTFLGLLAASLFSPFSGHPGKYMAAASLPVQEGAPQAGRAGWHRARLELARKYDRLKLPQVLDELNAEYSRGGMADTSDLVLVLAHIAGDPAQLRMARRKAESLLDRIRDGRPTLDFEKALLQPQLSHWTVRIRDDGQAHYSFASGAVDTASAENAQTFSLSTATVQQFFSLAEQVKNFRGATSEQARPGVPLLMEIGLGYEKGPEHYRVTYVSAPGGKTGRLVKLFEGIANQRWHMANLKRAMTSPEASRGIEVWRVLTALEADLKKSRVVEPEAFVPLLREIAASGQFAADEADFARRLLQSLGVGAP